MHDPNCIFCKILQGEIPCSRVYETPEILAFLDIAPVNLGHVLVIPKTHLQDIWALPPTLAPQMLEAIQTVGNAMKEALGATGMNVGMNNGASAGQLVRHAHWHLIPRFEDDGLSLWPQKHYDDPGEMERVAKAIARAVS